MIQQTKHTKKCEDGKDNPPGAGAAIGPGWNKVYSPRAAQKIFWFDSA
jgi:hypothetical protein